MKGIIRFHKGDAFPFDRVGNDHRGLTFDLPGSLQGRNEGLNIVPVRLFDVPAKGSPLVHERFQPHLPADWAAFLVLIVIDDGGQVIDP